MKKCEVETLVKGIAPALVEAIKRTVDPMKARISALEARPEVSYRGVHIAGDDYFEGNLVTRSGALWLAIRSTSQMPGQSGDWKLIVKSGGAV